jgi:hypothetical protein
MSRNKRPHGTRIRGRRNAYHFHYSQGGCPYFVLLCAVLTTVWTIGFWIWKSGHPPPLYELQRTTVDGKPMVRTIVRGKAMGGWREDTSRADTVPLPE